jgi:hypothetical protein
MALTSEQQQMFKAYFYTKLSWGSVCRSGELIRFEYVDENELVYERAREEMGQRIAKTKPDALLYEIQKAKANGFTWKTAVSQIEEIQKLAAVRVQELEKQIQWITDHQYKSAAEKKRFITGFNKDIKVLKQIIRDAEQSKQFARSKA